MTWNNTFSFQCLVFLRVLFVDDKTTRNGFSRDFSFFHVECSSIKAGGFVANFTQFHLWKNHRKPQRIVFFWFGFQCSKRTRKNEIIFSRCWKLFLPFPVGCIFTSVHNNKKLRIYFSSRSECVLLNQKTFWWPKLCNTFVSFRSFVLFVCLLWLSFMFLI